jgi:hypothetical protein
MTNHTNGSYCWACGANVAGVWHSYIDGGQRCDPCFRVDAPLDPAHVGKLTDMDRLPAAKKPNATPRDLLWERLSKMILGVKFPPSDLN